MIENLKKYYQKRATEYELIYHKQERQADLKKLHLYLKKAFQNKKVFEIACGTGYWTKTIAESCNQILATDINEEVLTIARARDYGQASIQYKQLDLWQLEKGGNNFDSVFGGFIWSHILKTDIPKFLKKLQNQLTANGELIFIDNKYVEGSSTPIARTDEDGNTYQIRRLQNGETYEVLKNFLSEKEIESLKADLGLEMEWRELAYFWILKLKQSR